MGLAMVPMLQYVLPFAAGFGATLAYHRQTSENELTAAKASGVSHRALLMPALELAVHHISIASVIQHEALEEQQDVVIPLVIMTHTALLGDFRAALADIDRLDCVAAPCVYYPVAD